MKSRYHINISEVITLLLLLCLGTDRAMGQEAVPVDVNCKVTIYNKYSKKESTEVVLWNFFANIDKAKDVAKRVNDINKNGNSDLLQTTTALEKIKKANNITRKSKGNGRFSFKGISGMGIVVIYEDECEAQAFEVKAGKSDYELKFEVQRIADVEATGKRKLKPRTTIIETDNGMEMFKIQIPIEEELIKESSRLIIQTYAVDCMTDDTVDYCKPVVYEEGEYHDLQDKRMDYDFFQNDKLAKGYASGGIPTFIDTTIVYEKPDKKRSYKGPSKYAIEDYHHVYYTNTVGGSCLRIRPFKFLDFSVAIPEMQLTEEFRDDVEDVMDDKNIVLNLKFVQGKDELTDDSINVVEQDKLVRELKSHGENLVAPVIVGTASPEGSEKINKELAEKRARKARAMVAPYLSRKTQLSVQTKIYTWDDVATELANLRRADEAQAVREVIAASGSNKLALDKAIRELPFYEASVVPIMNNMRMMRCNYSVIVAHKMEPDEAVDAYYRNKKEYLSGEKSLSGGDYYNLYDNITDTVELDTVTMMAYKWLKAKPVDDLYGQKMAPYVYYRMARLLQRHGTPDTLLLAPFIDDSVGIDIMVNKYGEAVKMNRQDIYVAQAMNYYQLQKFNKAQEYINYLKDYGKTPPGLDKLEMFMNLKNYYGRDEDNPDFIRARDFILNSSDENKAILYTEIPEWRVSFEDTDDLINKLENNNPKKWYLKGLLWSTKADGEQPRLDEYYPEEDNDGFRRLTKAEEDSLIRFNYAEFEEYEKQLKEYMENHKDDVETEPVDISGIKHYLAYFHRCFQIEPTFKRYYFSEGHIDDDMRKKYKYLKKDFAGYEEVFKLLQVRDDRRREELMPSEDDEEDIDGVNGAEGSETARPSDASHESQSSQDSSQSSESSDKEQ